MKKEMVTDKDIVDVKGWKIPKGTTLYIQKKKEIKNPMSGHTEIWYVAKVDNGTESIGKANELLV